MKKNMAPPYEQAKEIRIVLDNLNTHFEKSFYGKLVRLAIQMNKDVKMMPYLGNREKPNHSI